MRNNDKNSWNKLKDVEEYIYENNEESDDEKNIIMMKKALKIS